MNKKEILEAAQKNKGAGEYEDHVFFDSANWGAFVGAILCGILFLIEWSFGGSFNKGLIAIAFTIVGVQAFIEGLKIKKRSYQVIGICALLVSITMTILFVVQVVVK